ncbi:MAG TPA: FAD-binding oxidoreductase [Candidatus Bathyarchaeia archaeon]|nr:FAD-binding oxidoreductase [Candidatus Bathyarchaeia archaeon]
MAEAGWRHQAFAGWGRVARAEMDAARPERVAEVARALAAAGREGIIAYAGGRSYGDAALNAGGRAILTSRLDRLLDFDTASGLLAAEAGVTFEDLRRIFLPRGFLAPVTPGTAFATLGGALANDVHGKNQDQTGNFGAHVAWIDLMLPSGELRRIGPEDRLFRATAGGLGLTGIIVALALRMARVPSRFVRLEERRVGDLDEFLAVLEAARSKCAYSVGWVDALASGRQLGRGIVESADPAPPEPGDDFKEPRRKRLPFDLPGFALNPLSVGLFNALYWRRVPAAGRERRVALDKFLYPLDSIVGWNRLYGRRGFHQFQCLLPEEASHQALRAILETCSGSRAASFLAVLKTMGRDGVGLLSFGGRGHTLALDFPAFSGVDDLLIRLERLVLDHGGKIYLAKDARLSAEGFARMYPGLPEFRAMLAEVDPTGRMASDLSRRLKIKAGSP